MAIGVKVMRRPEREVSYIRATLKGMTLTFKARNNDSPAKMAPMVSAPALRPVGVVSIVRSVAMLQLCHQIMSRGSPKLVIFAGHES